MTFQLSFSISLSRIFYFLFLVVVAFSHSIYAIYLPLIKRVKNWGKNNCRFSFDRKRKINDWNNEILSGLKMAVNSLDCNKLLSLGPFLTIVMKIFAMRFFKNIRYKFIMLNFD